MILNYESLHSITREPVLYLYFNRLGKIKGFILNLRRLWLFTVLLECARLLPYSFFFFLPLCYVGLLIYEFNVLFHGAICSALKKVFVLNAAYR